MTVLATFPGEAIPHQTVPTSQHSTPPHPLGFAESVKEPPQATTLPMPSPKAEDITALAPLRWMQVHPSRPVGPLGLVPHDLVTEQYHHHSCSCSSHKRAQAQAERNWQADVVPDSSTAITTREPSTMDQRPPLTLMGIAWSMHGDEPAEDGQRYSPEVAGGQDPLLVMGSSLVSTRLLVDLLSVLTYIDDMVASSFSPVSLNPSPMLAVDCPMPTLEGWEDMGF